LPLKDYEGLREPEVSEMRKKYGSNILTPPARSPWWKLYLEKYEDPVIRILLVAAVISFAAGFAHGEYIETVGIVLAVFLATTMAFLNEYKAGREFDILNKVDDEDEYRTLRDGELRFVKKKDLVVNDILLLETGDESPADLVVLESASLQVDESSLTGESKPAKKGVSKPGEPAEREKTAAYPENIVLRSSTVRDGHGIFCVSSVGDSTEIGKTAREASVETDMKTPLDKQLEKLSKIIGVVGFGVAFMLFAALTVRGTLVGEIAMNPEQWMFTLSVFAGVLIATAKVWMPVVYDAFEIFGNPKKAPRWLEAEGAKPWAACALLGVSVVAAATLCLELRLGVLDVAYLVDGESMRRFLNFGMIAITIIVVAVPEGLAMSVTLSLAYSMRKMTASNNLVRKMHACETIGAATVICTDKTGTLTENKMKVVAANLSELDEAVFEAIASNSTADLSFTEKTMEPTPMGNPTEGALLSWIHSMGADYRRFRDGFSVTRSLAFSTERKMMATWGVSASGEKTLHVKGAPEKILSWCRFSVEGIPLDEEKRRRLASHIESYQSKGMRVVALSRSRREAPEVPDEEMTDDLFDNMTWLGFFAISDPVRSDVPDAVAACRTAGLDVKMVTGDNMKTALQIAVQSGILSEDESKEAGRAMTGDEFEAACDSMDRESLDRLKVVSRARPLHKLNLVKSLQRVGHVVAVTGDGTNDAPALHHADVGLSMGKCGTAVAKEASDIVLLDDSFPSIVNAVMWGRSLYSNIQRFILFQLTVNVAALLTALLGPFLGVELPFTVTQMLWVNLIMDTLAALALATEPPHKSVMKNPPRKPEDFIVTPAMGRKIAGFGLSFVAVLVAGMFIIRSGGETGAKELTIFFSVFVMMQFWNLFNARRLGFGRDNEGSFLDNRAFVVIAAFVFFSQVAIVTWGGDVFRTVPLSFGEWTAVVAGTSVVAVAGRLFEKREERAAVPVE